MLPHPDPMTPPLDIGPVFRGTLAPLRPGDLLTSGRNSNDRLEIVMNHVSFTATVDGGARGRDRRCRP